MTKALQIVQSEYCIPNANKDGTKAEEWDVSLSQLCHKFLVRPIQLLCTPICALVALYASFCYGILYMQILQ